MIANFDRFCMDIDDIYTLMRLEREAQDRPGGGITVPGGGEKPPEEPGKPEPEPEPEPDPVPFEPGSTQTVGTSVSAKQAAPGDPFFDNVRTQQGPGTWQQYMLQMRLAQGINDFADCLGGVGRSMRSDAARGAFYGAIATSVPMAVAGGAAAGPKGALIGGLKGAGDGAMGGAVAGAVHGFEQNIGKCF